MHQTRIAACIRDFPSWMRNIRDFIREKQKVVLKVLLIGSEKGYIDLSFRRITKHERIENFWKKDRKGEDFLISVVDKLHLPAGEVYQK
jgi:translation initiation factor 2 subunit 1